MKLRTLLFIFSICMIGLTSMASTPLMEQKQKTTIRKAIVSPVVANVVTFDVISFDNVEIQMSNTNALIFVKEKQPINLVTTIKDVGWLNRKAVNFNTFYKEIQNQEIVFIDPLTRNCRSNS